MNDEEISRFLRRNAEQALRSIDTAPLLGQLLEVMTVGDRHEEILDNLLSYADELLGRHQAFIRDTVREAMPWYVPRFVHDQVYASVLRRIKEWIAEINGDPQHEMRQHFRESTRDFISDLRTSARFREEGERIRDWLVTHPLLRRYLDQIWEDLKNRALQDASNSESAIRKLCGEALNSIGRSINADAAFRQRINRRLTDWSSRFVSRYGDAIAGFVEETVRSWDEETIVDKLELSVGKDLQYIRLNGTLVGGLIGLIVYGSRLLLLAP